VTPHYSDARKQQCFWHPKFILLPLMDNSSTKKRFFEYGFSSSLLKYGNNNSITDVGNIRVGHSTKVNGTDVRTGVTVIDPGIENLFRNKIPAATYVGNGYGKITGTTQVEELGTIETPIALTNTLAVGPVMRGVIDHVINNQNDLQPTESINVVVGETNDGFLNDLHKNSVDANDVESAFAMLSNLTTVGNVGAGTGTRCFSWKGGIGTASRLVTINGKTYTLGTLLQTNFGGSLNIAGAPIGKILGKNDYKIEKDLPDGSCMIVIATDAPFSARQLKRIAKRAPLGLARTGSVMAHGSGDYAIAFSINRAGVEGENNYSCLTDNDLTNFFLAVVECVEESVYDALFAADTMSGRAGNKLEALPKKQVISYLEKYANIR